MSVYVMIDKKNLSAELVVPLFKNSYAVLDHNNGGKVISEVLEED